MSYAPPLAPDVRGQMAVVICFVQQEHRRVQRKYLGRVNYNFASLHMVK
jgi:hypothetical protein